MFRFLILRNSKARYNFTSDADIEAVSRSEGKGLVVARLNATAPFIHVSFMN
jgi:hypothetical protein